MNQPDIELTLVVRRARRGEADAIEQLARRALTLALRTSVAILGSRDEAADVAQEAAIDALRDLSSLRDPQLFDGWVYRIAARRTLRLLKSKRGRMRAESSFDELGEDQLSGGFEDVALTDRLAVAPAVRAALGELPPRQRVALALHYVAGCTDAQIAEVLCCRRGTVGSLLSRGRASLQANPLLAEFRPSHLQGEC